jgi:hypothetical protein
MLAAKRNGAKPQTPAPEAPAKICSNTRIEMRIQPGASLGRWGATHFSNAPPACSASHCGIEITTSPLLSNTFTSEKSCLTTKV